MRGLEEVFLEITNITKGHIKFIINPVPIFYKENELCWTVIIVENDKAKNEMLKIPINKVWGKPKEKEK